MLARISARWHLAYTHQAAAAHAGAQQATLTELALPPVSDYPIDAPCADAAGAGDRCHGRGPVACAPGLICFQLTPGYAVCDPPEWLDSDDAADEEIVAASAGCDGAVGGAAMPLDAAGARPSLRAC